PPASPAQVFNLVKDLKGDKTSERAIQVSGKLLGRPFEYGPCGEGRGGDFDQRPISTFEKFDCTTFVEAVLALSNVTHRKSQAQAYADFLAALRGLKYRGGKVCYASRNHFPETDWLPNAQKKGYLTDITAALDPAAGTREILISKKNWYENKTKADIFRPDLTGRELEEKFKQMKELAGSMPRAGEKAALKYIPLKRCFDPGTQKKFPDIVLFNTIKAENTKIKVPTAVSHQGFIIRKTDGQLYVRHAAAAAVTKDVLFVDYLNERLTDTAWPTLGFNIQRIN
ncbi:MAG TPA: N-acetylmuramoyl-L-alanine amidase-like domain-containing protein, partial [Candidatus Sulfotelmatobacter sp.]|nr:N-acetylmuramoyl-L-alanine amidase-like domain-containing protein [Candidatus Sulfotelmatobacter sp.]